MYFLPKSNKLIACIILKKTFHLYAITISIALLITSVWFYGINGLLEKKINSAHYRIKQAHDIFLQMNGLEASHKQLVQLVEHAQQALHSYRPEDDSQNTIDSSVVYLLEQAQRLSLTINTFLVSEPQDMNWYYKQDLTLDLSGSLDNLMNFLDLFVHEDSLLLIKNSSLSVASHNRFTLKMLVELMTIK